VGSGGGHFDPQSAAQVAHRETGGRILRIMRGDGCANGRGDLRAMAGQAAGLPPGIRLGPFLAPSSPPETPVPTKRIPFPARYPVRLLVSGKWLLPPSMTMSPGSRNGSRDSMNWSTTSPALTMSITLRGRLSSPMNSSMEWAGSMVARPLASSARNSPTLPVVRL